MASTIRRDRFSRESRGHGTDQSAAPEREWEAEMLGRAAGSDAGGSLLHSGWEEPCRPAQSAFPWLLWAQRCSLLPSTHKKKAKVFPMFKPKKDPVSTSLSTAQVVAKCERCTVLPCVLASVCAPLEELNEADAASSESSGVGRGGGNWMLVRSGREPPVLWAAGFSDVVICWSGDGNMLQKTE